jgi:hypothetical protein
MFESFNYTGLLGTRKAKSHTHMTLCNADFYLDGEPIVQKGKIVKDGL